MITYNLAGTIYVAMKVNNHKGGYIAYGKTIQEAINNLFIIYNQYNFSSDLKNQLTLEKN